MTKLVTFKIIMLVNIIYKFIFCIKKKERIKWDITKRNEYFIVQLINYFFFISLIQRNVGRTNSALFYFTFYYFSLSVCGCVNFYSLVQRLTSVRANK